MAKRDRHDSAPAGKDRPAEDSVEGPRCGRHVAVGLALVVLGGMAFYFFAAASRYDTETRIEFDGEILTSRMPGEEFLSLPHDKRAEVLARQVSAVVEYVKSKTESQNIVDVVCRLETAGPGQMRIRASADPNQQEIMKCNRIFTSNIRVSAPQAKFLSRMISEFNRDSYLPPRSEQEYLRKMSGFSDTGFYQSWMTDGSIRYLERAMIIKDIASAVLRDRQARSDQEKLEALMDWTFVNVSNHFDKSARGHSNFADFNDIPLELMLRGMGACDRSAWVLARLAFHSGLRSHVVYLHKPEDEGEVSFHTISEIRTDKGWRAADPFNNILYDRSIPELAKDTEYFDHSWIFINNSPPQAYLPIMKLAEMICQFYVPGQRLFVDIRKSTDVYVRDEFEPNADASEIGNIITLMSQNYAVKLPPNEVAITRWEMPFWLRGFYYQNVYLSYKYKKLPFMAKLRDVRMKQLLGKYSEAEDLFETMKKSEDTDILFVEERDYFMILNDYYRRKFPDVEEGVLAYRRRHPDSPRNTMLRYLLAHSLKNMGRIAEAEKVYPAGSNFKGRGRIVFSEKKPGVLPSS